MIKHKKTLFSIIEIIIISILIFSSISFISFSLPVIFINIEFNEINIGFPFNYFNERRITDRDVARSWNIIYLTIDFVFSFITTVLFVKYFSFKKIFKRKFFGKFIISTLYSIMIFFTISYFGLIKSILFNIEYEIGFPLKYFEMFWLGGNYFPNHGSDVKNLLLNCLIIWTITILLIFIFVKILKIKYHTKFNNNIK